MWKGVGGTRAITRGACLSVCLSVGLRGRQLRGSVIQSSQRTTRVARKKTAAGCLLDLSRTRGYLTY